MTTTPLGPLRPLARSIALLAGCLTLAAQAHVVLEQPAAEAGSSYRAAFRVSHGCEGSPTHTVRVTLPAGFQGAKPMPLAGWTVSTRRERLAQAYESHGRRVEDDVVEVTWRAQSAEAALANDHYQEFVLRGTLPGQPGPLWFKVQQLCDKGAWNWAEVPTEGTSTKGLKSPAALLEVKAAAHRHAHH